MASKPTAFGTQKLSARQEALRHLKNACQEHPELAYEIHAVVVADGLTTDAWLEMNNMPKVPRKFRRSR